MNNDNSKLSKFIGIITFLTVTLIILAIIIFNLRESKNYYSIFVKFRFIGDLKEGAEVRYLGGFNIGYVKSIYQKDNWVEANLKIKNGISILKGSEFSIYTIGLLGARYIEVTPPVSQSDTKEFLKPGDVIWGNDAMGLEVIQYNLAKINIALPTDKEKLKQFDVILKNSASSLKRLKNDIQPKSEKFLMDVSFVNILTKKILSRIEDIEKSINYYKKDLDSLNKEKLKKYLKAIDELENIVSQLNNSSKILLDTSKKITYQSDKIVNKENIWGRLIYNDEDYKLLYKKTKEIEKITENLNKNSIFK